MNKTHSVHNDCFGTKRAIGTMLMAMLVLSTGSGGLANSSEDQKLELALEMATLFRSARKVISDNQALINDATKGEKGLTAEKVVEGTKLNYQQATGKALPDADHTTLADQVRMAMLQAVKEVMDEAQPLLNQPGKGFKGFLPAVFAKRVADKFSQAMDGKVFIKLTAPASYIRNRANRPDAWENSVIENYFKDPRYEKGKALAEAGMHKGRAGYRLMIPEYYGESCLACHGTPKGALDITGGKKEGGVLGELGGATSIVIY